MTTLNLIQTRINDWLSDHAEYWQDLISRRIDGLIFVPPDQLSTKPSDEDKTWMDSFAAATPCSIRIDTYNGGWVATVTVGYDGTLYQRSQNYGPETWRTKNWQIIE